MRSRIAGGERERTQVIILEEFTTQSVTSATRETREALIQLAVSISASQAALLRGCLPELERELSQQVEICMQLRRLLSTDRDCASHSLHGELLSPAKIALDGARVFAAILRRMRQTLGAMQAAMQPTPLTYGPPSGNPHYGNR